MKISATNSESGVALNISGKISRELQADDIPTATIKGAKALTITIDADITDPIAAIRERLPS